MQSFQNLLQRFGLWVGLLFISAGFFAVSAHSLPPLPSAMPAPLSKPATASVTVKAPVYKISPTVKQGQVAFIKVTIDKGALDQGVVWLAGRKVPLYWQQEGFYQAHVPVQVRQKPGGYTLKIQNRQGKTLHQAKIEVENARFSKQNIRTTPSVAGLQPEPGELDAIGRLKKITSPRRHWDQPFQIPTPDCMNSSFGNLRYHNGIYTGNYHKGIDLRSPMSRPVKATAGGKVTIARKYRLHGGTVGLDHGQNISSIYIHLSKIAVKPGDFVKKGQVIGYVGATGFATGPHLHWGLYVNGLPVNPLQWVPPIPRC